MIDNKLSDILENHLKKCAKENRFVEADLCKTKIAKLKEIEKEKLYERLLERHERTVCIVNR